MRKLVLLDIDGTILRSGRAGRAAMERALHEVFGTPGDPDYLYDGKTDRQIIRETIRMTGLDDAEIDERMDLTVDTYLRELEGELKARADEVKLFPGIRELVERVHAREDAVLGLLTGNVERGARLKLAAGGLEFDQFVVNAFGSDHETRGELPAVAHRRMREMFGVDLAGQDVIVVGDTPADVQCGRTLGARAIGVATGRYSVADLNAHHPFAAFDTLADTDAVMAVIDA